MELSKNNFLAGISTLLVCPCTFNYEKTISDAITRLGGSVFYIDERPGNDFFTKGIVRLRSSLLKTRIEAYYQAQLDALPPDVQFDNVLVISPEAINEEAIQKIKKRFSKAKFILYMWDSLRNKTGRDNSLLLPYFDRVLSFDRNDCSHYTDMRFRPLFYRDNNERPDDTKDSDVYDLSFIGTIHSDRYKICSQIKQSAENEGLKTFFYLYLNDKKLFWLYKATNPAMRGSQEKDFSFVPLPQTQVATILRKSRCVLDIQHPRQLGLTMRTIEVLGARRKLLTTNTDVKEYDFYSSDNYFCIDRTTLAYSKDFILSPYKPLDNSIYQKYSIYGWLAEVLL